MTQSGGEELAVEILPEEPPVDGKRWRIGTLAYTTAGLAVLFCWLLWGDFTFNLKDRAVSPSLLLLMKQYHSSDAVVVFMVGSLPAVISFMLMPIISYQSDRYRSRWGRRIPFLFMLTPIAVLAMIGLAFSPQIGARVSEFLHPGGNRDVAIIGTFGVFWVGFEFASLSCTYVIIPGLINDVVPREVIGRFFAMFRIFSLTAGITFLHFFMGKAEQYFVPLFLGMAALYGVSFMAMCLMVKEGEYPPPTPQASPNAGPLTSAIATYFRECFSHPYYLWVIASIALAYLGFHPINLFSIYFAKSVGMSMTSYGNYGALQLFISMIQAFPIGWLVDRFHPLRMTIVATLMYAILTLLAFFFVRDARMFAVAHVVCGSCSGFWLTVNTPMCLTLFPREKFGQFAAAATAAQSVGAMIISYLCGSFLDHVNHDYHYIYLWASTFVGLSLLTLLVVYRKFQDYGGPDGYVAPD